jgi:iron(III) transport system permease protein
MGNRAYISIDSANECDNAICLRRWRLCGFAFVFLLFAVTTLIPFISVLLNVQGPSRVIATLYSAGGSIAGTSILALLSALISLAVALPMGNYLYATNNRIARLIDMLSWLPIAIPGTIIGLGLIQLTNLSPTLRNADSFGWLLLCAYIGMFSPFAIRILKVSFSRSDSNLSDRATMDCSHWYQRLIFVDFQLHSSAIIASFIIVFVLVLGELNATVLLIPPGRETLAVKIDNLLHYGSNVYASILCLIEAALVIILLALGLFVRSIRWRTEK